MIDWLHDLPPLQGAALVICVFLLPTLIGSILFQPMVGWLVSREKNANTPVGFLLNAFTLYYGVLLALLSIAVFENYNKAEDAIAREASSLIALYRNVIGYPEPMRASLVDNLRRYVEEETTPAAWRARSPDEFSTAGTSLVDEINRQLVTFKPEDQSRDEALHAATLRSFNDFIGRRRERIQAMGTSIPPVIWYVVLIGAALNAFVLWLFDLSRVTHLILGGVLSFFIGLVIYMVAALDDPFRGAHGLGPDYLLYAHERMRPL
ncbi:MAG: bestrophin-like domain [Rhodoplanes sp.]